MGRGRMFLSYPGPSWRTFSSRKSENWQQVPTERGPHRGQSRVVTSESLWVSKGSNPWVGLPKGIWNELRLRPGAQRQREKPCRIPQPKTWNIQWTRSSKRQKFGSWGKACLSKLRCLGSISQGKDPGSAQNLSWECGPRCGTEERQ